MGEDYFEHIYVYKTDVKEPSKAEKILTKIRTFLPGSKPSFDLEDCDKVLRVEVETNTVDDLKIRELVKASGHQIEELA
ncbi:hypothetical protein ACG2F4_04585 [Halalkalibaculum sp. DA3122]|uniref:hypothetical protein n=1 Tax=unclassified Halalkalibaculum TaxID=2964617 RepID=UPI003754C44C